MSQSNDNEVFKNGIVVDIVLPFHVQIETEINPELTNDFYVQKSLQLHTQNKLAFDLADAFNQVERSEPGELSKQYKVLESKLNTILQLLRFMLSTVNTQAEQYPQQLKLSALAIEWDKNNNNDSFNFKIDQYVSIDLYPSNILPWPVKRMGRIVNVSASTVSVVFLPLDPENQERFEKWIFQLHRRSIHLLKQ